MDVIVLGGAVDYSTTLRTTQYSDMHVTHVSFQTLLFQSNSRSLKVHLCSIRDLTQKAQTKAWRYRRSIAA